MHNLSKTYNQKFLISENAAARLLISFILCLKASEREKEREKKRRERKKKSYWGEEIVWGKRETDRKKEKKAKERGSEKREREKNNWIGRKKSYFIKKEGERQRKRIW